MSEPLSNDQIAVCKRCGSEATADNVYSYGRSIGWRVFCVNCDNHGPLSQSKLAAERAWNTEQAA